MWIPNLRAFLTDDGILPRALQSGPSWGVFALSGSPAAVTTIFALGVAATIAFTLGWRTRVMTGLVWLLFVSLRHRALPPADGGDAIARMFLFWGLFTNLGGVWSLDARAGRGAATVPALGVRLIMLQLVCAYLGSSFLKVRGVWLHHNVIFQVMQLDGFVRPGGRWLFEYPMLCKLATLGTLAGELAIPILLFVPYKVERARVLGIAIATAIQLGILMTMRVGTFTGVMLWSSIVFVPVPWIERFTRRWQPNVPDPAATPPGRASMALAAVAVLQLGISTLDEAYRVPRMLQREVLYTSLEAELDLFSNDIDVQSWRAPGTLEDGTVIDVIPIAAPELQPTDGIVFSRWTKLRFRIKRPDALGAYLCREYAATTGHHLRSLAIEMRAHAPRAPGELTPETRVTQLWSGPCE